MKSKIVIICKYTIAVSMAILDREVGNDSLSLQRTNPNCKQLYTRLDVSSCTQLVYVVFVIRINDK